LAPLNTHVIASGNVTTGSRKLSELHPPSSGQAAKLKAGPELAQRVEREKSWLFAGTSWQEVKSFDPFDFAQDDKEKAGVHPHSINS
jgi:hypothetical protein